MTRIPFILLATATIIAACGGGHRTGVMGAPTTPSTTAPSGGAWIDDASMCSNRPDELGPAQLTGAQTSERYGTGVTALASITTSQAHPIEVCGVGGEMAWLRQSTCADGSHPYSSAENPDDSRAGDTGPGGRCNSIIDLYKVKCPEQTYDVYADMYLCGPGESFM